ncbi:hypothetical protein SLEP1_g6557 [Rubroshorea leprosula]|uniref:Uncharacterized protein n=1 Tax=Rubroshorea leprosula TaxID=152421 RepID=A0AAV5I5E5_9ROSI|nr:hypothetical protein SLEP1_g6557 [Rubroshorea leprosula]
MLHTLRCIAFRLGQRCFCLCVTGPHSALKGGKAMADCPFPKSGLQRITPANQGLGRRKE